MNSSSLVTVIMPAYNTGLYIRQAIESILNQTYQNFEFLIYDDSSTDNTVQIIESYTDERIRLYKKEKNTGYTNSLIKGIAEAKGKYIARMDSDDISHFHRLEKQVNFLEKNNEYGLVGSYVQTITSSDFSQVWKFPVDDADIRLFAIINSPFAHPSVLIRKEVLIKNQLTYSLSYEPCEDYKLWYDLLKVTKGKNLDEVLLYYRQHQNQTSILNKNKLIENSNKVRQLVFSDLFNIQLNEEDLVTNYFFFNEIQANSALSIQTKHLWRRKLKSGVWRNTNDKKVNNLLETYWIINLRTIAEFKFSFLKFLNNKSVISDFSFSEIVRFFIKCILCYKVPKKNNASSFYIL